MNTLPSTSSSDFLLLARPDDISHVPRASGSRNDRRTETPNNNAARPSLWFGSLIVALCVLLLVPAAADASPIRPDSLDDSVLYSSLLRFVSSSSSFTWYTCTKHLIVCSGMHFAPLAALHCVPASGGCESGTGANRKERQWAINRLEFVLCFRFALVHSQRRVFFPK